MIKPLDILFSAVIFLGMIAVFVSAQSTAPQWITTLGELLAAVVKRATIKIGDT